MFSCVYSSLDRIHLCVVSASAQAVPYFFNVVFVRFNGKRISCQCLFFVHRIPVVSSLRNPSYWRRRPFELQTKTTKKEKNAPTPLRGVHHRPRPRGSEQRSGDAFVHKRCHDYPTTRASMKGNKNKTRRLKLRSNHAFYHFSFIVLA